MTSDEGLIDRFLAALLRGNGERWPETFDPVLVVDRILYHGIAGLIADRASELADWPAAALVPVREQGVALVMWELRHKVILTDLLTALAAAGAHCLLLKGSALAYDLYPSPSTRARGDSDLLVAPAHVDIARSELAGLGYRREPLDEGIADDLALQEVWSMTCPAGTEHHIDLHWQLINAPALRGLLDFSLCAIDPLALPRLGPDARSMSRALTLLHTCVHRAMHLSSPYFVDGITYYGGDRLIWAMDIALLAQALSAEEWQMFTLTALDQGVGAVCRDGLAFAVRALGSHIPDGVMASLGAPRGERASAYLLGSGQAGRAWADLQAIRGIRRKLAYLGARSLPSARFMRGKYPGLHNRPLALLHLKRIVGLVRSRSAHGQRE